MQYTLLRLLCDVWPKDDFGAGNDYTLLAAEDWEEQWTKREAIANRLFGKGKLS
jgi:hypothetical protein